jgi:hypothetical protein
MKKINSIYPLNNGNQNGQVLAEAVVTLMLMSVFLIALHQVGIQFYQWFKWSDQVHQVAHKKAIFDETYISNGMSLMPGQVDLSHTFLQAQWALGQRDWVGVKVDKPFKHHALFISGMGATSTHQETTVRIKQNLLAWRTQALISQAKVWFLKPGLTAVDLPWRRTTPQTDWLSKWSNTAPNYRN